MLNLTKYLFFWVGVIIALTIVGYWWKGGPGAGAGMAIGFLGLIVAAIVYQSKHK